MTSKLKRKLSFIGLLSTGICSMLGASIYLVPFMIQRNVPGIGPYVLPAFFLALIPALLAAMCYAILSSSMPRAGGAYIYVSRGLSPYLGFVASFAQWFGLSVAIGVIGYVIIPFVRDVFIACSMDSIAEALEIGWIRVTIGLILLWGFIFVNMRGLTFYQQTLVPLMIIMFVLGVVVIFIGYRFDHETFIQTVDSSINIQKGAPFSWKTLLAGSAILISSFIGFDSIAQAGGEVKDPGRWLPKAIILCVVIVASFYFLFTSAVYHTVPWQYVAQEAMVRDLTAPGLFTELIPAWVTVLIVAGAAIALINDLPAMFLSVSRLVYAWAHDGVFPKLFSKVNPNTGIPDSALILSGGMATLGLLGSHFAGDFFLGVDIMVTSMLLNFLLICLSVIVIPRTNPVLAEEIGVFKNRIVQIIIAGSGSLILILFLILHIIKDLNNSHDAWYFHSTPVWFIVMIAGSLVYFLYLGNLKKSGVDIRDLFKTLPEE